MRGPVDRPPRQRAPRRRWTAPVMTPARASATGRITARARRDGSRAGSLAPATQAAPAIDDAAVQPLVDLLVPSAYVELAVQQTRHWLSGVVATPSVVTAAPPSDVAGGAAMSCNPSVRVHALMVVEAAPGAVAWHSNGYTVPSMNGTVCAKDPPATIGAGAASAGAAATAPSADASSGAVKRRRTCKGCLPAWIAKPQATTPGCFGLRYPHVARR
jgi:hypothetical protein